MSKRTSIGTWAYTIGPYADKPIDFDTVCTKLKELGFNGVELGAFPPHPNPGNPNGPDDAWPGAPGARGGAGSPKYLILIVSTTSANGIPGALPR